MSEVVTHAGECDNLVGGCVRCGGKVEYRPYRAAHMICRACADRAVKRANGYFTDDCVVCGKPLRRVHQKTCGATCRQRLRRLRARNEGAGYVR